MSIKNFLAAALVTGCAANQAQGVDGVQKLVDTKIDDRAQESARYADKLRLYESLKAEYKQLFDQTGRFSEKFKNVVGACDQEAYPRLFIENQEALAAERTGICKNITLVEVLGSTDPEAYFDEYEKECEGQILDKKREDGVDFFIRYYEKELIRISRIGACAKRLAGLSVPQIDQKVIQSKIPATIGVEEAIERRRKAMTDQDNKIRRIKSFIVPDGQGLYSYLKFTFCQDKAPEVSSCFKTEAERWKTFQTKFKAEIDHCDNFPPKDDFEGYDGECITWVAKHNHPGIYRDHLRQTLSCEEMRTTCLDQTLENLKK